MGCGGGGNSDWNPVNGVKHLTGTFRNDVFGTSDLADATQRANEEMQATAKQQRQEAIDAATKSGSAMRDLAGATPQELQAYTATLDSAQTQLDQRTRLLKSIDPAIMEASKQVLDVLQGKSTGVGNAIGTQRAQQRQQLVNQLRSQYGPGAETSSLGQQALQKFDMETNTMTANLQGSTLSNLYGVINGVNINDALQGTSMAGANFGNIQNRRLNAEQGAGNMLLGAMSGTNSAVLNTAGADQTANIINSGAQKQFWDNWSTSSMKFGEAFGGFGMGKAGGRNGNSGSGSPGTGGMDWNYGNAGQVGGFGLSNPGTTNSNFWSANPYLAPST